MVKCLFLVFLAKRESALLLNLDSEEHWVTKQLQFLKIILIDKIILSDWKRLMAVVVYAHF